MDTRTDEDLVRAHRAGERDAFAVLANRYLSPLYNFAYRLSGKKEEAEEITQETFFKIWKHLPRFRTEEKFKTWAYAILRNSAIDALRKKRSAVFSDFETEDWGIEDTLADTERLADEVFAVEEERGAVSEHLFDSALPV